MTESIIQDSPPLVTVEAQTQRHVSLASSTELAASSPMGMMLAARAQGASFEDIEKMMDLQERYEKREAEKAYNVAFAAFKAEAVRIVKRSEITGGPTAGRKYAELFTVVDAVTPALSRHGLSAAWKLTQDAKDWMEVTCTLKHVGGHSESVSMGGPPDASGAKNPLQARASTKSYLERYTLKSICGVAEGGDDNDGGALGSTELLDGWIAFARDVKFNGTPDEFKKACRDGRTAISATRNAKWLSEFNAAVA